MNSPRNDFLSRVRQAVGAGNRPGVGGSIEPRGRTGCQSAGVDTVQRFREQFTAVGGLLHLVADGEGCIQKIVELIQEKSPRQVLLGRGPVIDRIRPLSRLKEAGIPAIFVDELRSESWQEAFFAADVGITGVEYLVAETGTLVLHSRADHPRSLSLLPPIHIAIAGPNQLVDDLFDLFPQSEVEKPTVLPSCITFITGPSKTGDIELRLVTGVHGPGEIHVILIDR